MAYELFIDGFDHYDTANITKKWQSNYNGNITAGVGRRSTGALRLATNANGATLISQALTPYRYITIGFALYVPTGASGPFQVYIYSGTTTQFRFLLTSTFLQWEAYRVGATAAAISDKSMPFDVWQYIEIGVDLSDTGSYELRVNGSSSGWLPKTDYDTLVTAGGKATAFSLGRPGGAITADVYVDDLYAVVGDEIKFLGDSRVDTLRLTDNFTPQDWDPTFYATPDVSLLLNANAADGSTTFTDSSSYAYTPVGAGNAKISTEQSKFGGSSIKLDGTGDYLTLDATSAPAFGTGDFTIEAWVYLPAYQGAWFGDIASVIIDTRSAGTVDGFIFYMDNLGCLQVWEHGLPKLVNIVPNQWAHVAYVRSNGVIRGYINGELSGSVTATRNCTSTKLTIGCPSDQRNTGAAGGKLIGYIDGLRITKGVALYLPGSSTAPTSELTNVITQTPAAWSLLNYKAGTINGSATNETSLFELDNLTHNPTGVHGVQVSSLVTKQDAGYREISSIISSSGTTTVSQPLPLSTSELLLRSMYIDDPATSSPWTKTQVNNAKIGVKVIA